MYLRLLLHELFETGRKAAGTAAEAGKPLLAAAATGEPGHSATAQAAETAAAAEAACRAIAVTYDVLPAVFEPEEARTAGAPLLHPERTPDDRVAEASRNVVAAFHEEHGDTAAALAARVPRRGACSLPRAPPWC